MPAAAWVNFTLVDFDVVTESNINRQLYALNSTLGQFKTEAAKERISDINPYCQVDAVNVRFDAESLAQFDFSKFDYVADAIDTVTSKLLLIETCVKRNVPVISCMGAETSWTPRRLKLPIYLKPQFVLWQELCGVS